VGAAPGGGNIFQLCFILKLITLVNRQIAENFVDIHS